MNNSRRTFLKLAGISALGAGAGSLLDIARGASPAEAAEVAGTTANQYAPDGKALKGKHWGMVIDTRKFDTPEMHKKVIDACHLTHNVPTIPGNQDVKWIWTEEFGAAFTDNEQPYLPHQVEQKRFLLLCNHCENPPCVRVCPTKATFKRADGIVMMDFHRCIGCRFCMAACPFGARSFNFGDPRPYLDPKTTNPAFPTRMRGVVEKCTFCAERLDVGLMPACAEASGGAILFGDLDDAKSEVRAALRENFTIRRKPTLGTQPSVYYII